ncbi:MAG: hypothetical protein ACRC1W_06335 [Shewanella sp.]
MQTYFHCEHDDRDYLNCKTNNDGNLQLIIDSADPDIHIQSVGITIGAIQARQLIDFLQRILDEEGLNEQV